MTANRCDYYLWLIGFMMDYHLIATGNHFWDQWQPEKEKAIEGAINQGWVLLYTLIRNQLNKQKYMHIICKATKANPL